MLSRHYKQQRQLPLVLNFLNLQLQAFYSVVNIQNYVEMITVGHKMIIFQMAMHFVEVTAM